MPFRFRRWIWAAALIPLLPAWWVYRNAERAKAESGVDAAGSGRLTFTLHDFHPPIPTGIEQLRVAPGLRDIATLNGRVYISAATGLYAYDGEHAAPQFWRAGIELPAAEFGPLTTAVLGGSGGRELAIATSSAGLLLFDGARFRRLLPEKPEFRRVTALLPLRTGRILYGTETAGVAVYDGQTLAVFDPALASERITALAGSEGDIWIGTLRDGLWHAHAGQLEQFKDALPDPQILSLAVDGESAFAGTSLGVVEFRGGIKTRVIGEGVFARSLLPTTNGLFIGTEDEGIYRIGPKDHSDDGDTLAGEAVERLRQLDGASFAITPSAVYRSSGAGWKPILTPGMSGLTDRDISALSFDATGKLWVGYFDRGLDILAADQTDPRHFEDDRLFCINRIVANGANTAVATANGLVLFDGEKARQVLGRKDGLMADHVTDVVFAKDGLIAATPAGLSFVNSGGVRSLYAFQGLVNNHVYALGLAGDRLLAGTLGGVSVLDHETVRTSYTRANSGLQHNWITALAPVGDEWFAGTYGAGVMRLDTNGVWHAFPNSEKYVVNPNAMLVWHGRVLAGSLANGLYVYSSAEGRWRNFTTGLPSLNVTALAAAGAAIYAGTANGAVRIEERVLP